MTTYKPTNREVASSYSLWLEYHDPNGLFSEAEFEAMSPEARLASIEDAHGEDEGDCGYCNAYISAPAFEAVPEIDDDAEWERLATLHAEGCDWIETRAHRQ